MARIKIKLPQSFEFSTEIPIRISDVNYGGHMGHDAVLSLIHEARMRFLGAMGFSELDIYGFAIILADAVIVYKSEAFYGDTLKIGVTRDDYNKYGCDLFYKLTNKATGREVARAKTGIVFFDYDTRKMVRAPERFKEQILTE